MSEFIRTTLEEWNTAATVISVLITGVLALVGFIYRMIKTDPVERRAKKAEARESDAAAHKMTVEGLYGLIDRLETRLERAEKSASSAEDEAHQAKTQAEKAENDVGILRSEMEDVKARYAVLREWVNRIVSNWSTLRQSADPPALPPEIERTDTGAIEKVGY